MKKLHIIWAHPRKDSLTARTVDAVQQEAIKEGFEVTTWEAYSAGFDPLVREIDEPSWDDPNKVYSPEAVQLAKDLEDKDYLVFVFPVWWYSLPAILKGYIDRVWNYGVFYGNREVDKLPVKAVRWIGLIGSDEPHIQKRDYDKYMLHYFNIGLAGYCGVDDSKVKFIYDTIGRKVKPEEAEAYYTNLIAQAVEVIRELPK